MDIDLFIKHKIYDTIFRGYAAWGSSFVPSNEPSSCCWIITLRYFQSKKHASSERSPNTTMLMAMLGIVSRFGVRLGQVCVDPPQHSSLCNKARIFLVVFSWTTRQVSSFSSNPISLVLSGLSNGSTFLRIFFTLLCLCRDYLFLSHIPHWSHWSL